MESYGYVVFKRGGGLLFRPLPPFYNAELEGVNVLGAQESISRNRFRQPL
jgi:hypothetical protein